MLSCCNSSSAAVVKLVCDTMVKVGGRSFLKSQLTATRSDGLSCLMRGCMYSSSPEVMKLLFQKIIEVGGPELLQAQLTSSDTLGWNCLMVTVRNTSSAQVAKLVFEKISEVGGPQLLRKQITATTKDLMNLLMATCCNSSSAEVVKLVFQKIAEVGGTQMLQSQLNAKNKSGWNALMFACKHSNPEVMLLTASLSFHLNATDFSQQYQRAARVSILKRTLEEKVSIHSASWMPPEVSVTEIENLLEPALVKRDAGHQNGRTTAPAETALYSEQALRSQTSNSGTRAGDFGFGGNCDRDAGFMAGFSVIILILQGVTWSQPLYTVAGAHFYFSRSCVVAGDQSACVNYPDNFVCNAQQANSAANLGAMIVANLCCFLALIFSCCATSRITHGVLFLSSLICSIVNVAVTATLSSLSSCPAIKDLGVSGSTDAGFILLVVILVLNVFALIRVYYNKVFLKWCGRTRSCSDIDDEPRVIIVQAPSSASEMEYQNYGGTSSSVNAVSRFISHHTHVNSGHQFTPTNNNINNTTAPTPIPPPPTIPDWMSSLPIDDDMKALLVKERINEASFLLLEENDLKELGLPLGPRKQLVQEILRRKQERSD